MLKFKCIDTDIHINFLLFCCYGTILENVFFFRSKSPTHWSSCSYEYLALSFERSMDYCLRNKPTRLFDSPVCGNGFVEPGEQCDCGLPDYCNNPCCNAATCMLYSNATCATGHCCDLEVSINIAVLYCDCSCKCYLDKMIVGLSPYQYVFKISI